MASSASTSSQYAYQRPSTVATRTLVSGTQPTEVPSASSHEVEGSSDRPTLQRKTTDHYQQAVQQAASSKSDTPTIDNLQSTDPTKPALSRQQSWKHSDLKRDAMEKILNDRTAGHGYTSTNTAS